MASPARLLIQVKQPGERANEILVVIAQKLGFENLDERGPDHSVMLPEMEPSNVAGVRELIEEALDEAGEDARLFVDVR